MIKTIQTLVILDQTKLPPIKKNGVEYLHQ